MRKRQYVDTAVSVRLDTEIVEWLKQKGKQLEAEYPGARHSMSAIIRTVIREAMRKN